MFKNFNVKLSKAGKVVGIIIAIAMIIIGILLLATPLRTTVALIYILSAIILVYGAYKFITFFVEKTKNPLSLVLGIVFIILGILLLSLEPIQVAFTFAIIVGAIMILNGIERLFTIPACKAAGVSVGLPVFSAILSIALAIFLFVTPFGTTWVFAVFAGVFMLIDGIIALVDFISAPAKKN